MDKILLEKLKQYKQNKIINYIRNLEEGVLPDSNIKILKLENQLKNIDFDFFFNKIVPFKDKKSEELKIEPHPVLKMEDIDNEKREYYKEIGEKVLKNGEVAFLVVAGGQGSRLGFEHPKGMFPIAPITNKSLFQIHCEKVLSFSKYYNFSPIFLIMTSETNHDETVDFFEKNKYFNLPSKSLIFFKQGMLPAIDFEGELILESDDSLFFAPDGHGGTLFALKKNNILKFLKEKNINIISYFQVDNPLVYIADPIFLGAHIDGNYEVSSKVLKKRDWQEKVGVPAYLNGKPSIVEYSDLPDDLAKLKDEKGNLIYGFGSIAIHLFNVDFIEKITSNDLFLPYHIAKKKIPFFDTENYKKVNPDNNNGIKFEQFIFDSIPMAKNALFFETDRDLEFKPLKNKEGEDSIETCKKGISDFYKIWFKKADYEINDNQLVEVSPLFACIEEEFRSKVWKFVKNIPNKIYIE